MQITSRGFSQLKNGEACYVWSRGCHHYKSYLCISEVCVGKRNWEVARNFVYILDLKVVLNKPTNKQKQTKYQSKFPHSRFSFIILPRKSWTWLFLKVNILWRNFLSNFREVIIKSFIDNAKRLETGQVSLSQVCIIISICRTQCMKSFSAIMSFLQRKAKVRNKCLPRDNW